MDQIKQRLIDWVNMIWRMATTRELGYLATWLAIPMGLATLVFLALSAIVRGWWQSILIELGVTLLGVLLTVFYVDRVLSRREEQRWSGPRSIALIRIRRNATRFVRYVTEVFYDPAIPERFPVPYWQVRVDQLNWVRVLYEDETWLSYIGEEFIPDSQALMASVTPEQSERLIGSLDILERKLREDISLFPAMLSPTQIENITSMLDVIPLERRLFDFKRSGAPNQAPPSLTDLLTRSLALIRESNEHEERSLPPAWEDIGPAAAGGSGQSRNLKLGDQNHRVIAARKRLVDRRE